MWVLAPAHVRSRTRSEMFSTRKKMTWHHGQGTTICPWHLCNVIPTCYPICFLETEVPGSCDLLWSIISAASFWDSSHSATTSPCCTFSPGPTSKAPLHLYCQSCITLLEFNFNTASTKFFLWLQFWNYNGSVVFFFQLRQPISTLSVQKPSSK